MMPLALGLLSAFLAMLLEGCSSHIMPAAVSAYAGADADRPVVIRRQHHRVYKNLHVSSYFGNCVRLIDSSDITIEASQIGPCGGNGIAISGGSVVRIYDS